MTFEKYNANPENKNIGDCSIRAICTATPLTYQQAKKLLETKVFESGAAWNTVKNITAALADLGIEVKAASRETVNSFTKPGRIYKAEVCGTSVSNFCLDR